MDSVERSARSSFSNRASRCGVLGAAMSPFMTLSASASLSDASAEIRGHHALARIGGQKCFGFLQRIGIEIGRECAQGRRLEDIDAKRTDRGHIHRLQLRIGQRRRGVAFEQFANMRRHRTQRCAHLLADGGILIELRRGVDIDRRHAGVGETGETQEECKAKHVGIVHSSSRRAGIPRCPWVTLNVGQWRCRFCSLQVVQRRPPPPPQKTVFDPLTQQLDKAREVQKTVDESARKNTPSDRVKNAAHPLVNQ